MEADESASVVVPTNSTISSHYMQCKCVDDCPEIVSQPDLSIVVTICRHLAPTVTICHNLDPSDPAWPLGWSIEHRPPCCLTQSPAQGDAGSSNLIQILLLLTQEIS
eukprot:1144583-Pelagomonas_calceolata.AAC.6